MMISIRGILVILRICLVVWRLEKIDYLRYLLFIYCISICYGILFGKFEREEGYLSKVLKMLLCFRI